MNEYVALFIGAMIGLVLKDIYSSLKKLFTHAPKRVNQHHVAKKCPPNDITISSTVQLDDYLNQGYTRYCEGCRWLYCVVDGKRNYYLRKPKT